MVMVQLLTSDEAFWKVFEATAFYILGIQAAALLLLRKRGFGAGLGQRPVPRLPLDRVGKIATLAVVLLAFYRVSHSLVSVFLLALAIILFLFSGATLLVAIVRLPR